MHQLIATPHGPVFGLFIVAMIILLGPPLMERLRLPGLLGLVLGGVIVGPNGAGLIQQTSSMVPAVGQLGLLYLMFTAGLELDLHVFVKEKRRAAIFGIVTFLCPMVLGYVAGRVAGYRTLAAILLGSVWASHTLITLPILKKLGLSSNRAVNVTVGATVLTDTLALLILSVVSSLAGQSGGDGGLRDYVRLAVGLAALLVFSLVVLPRVTRWIFCGIAQERALRFVFLLAAMASGAGLAELVGLEGIVGAFFAGLGVNKQVPNGSPLMDRTEFFGNAFFVPIFLISVGFVLDFRVIIDPHTLKLAAICALAVVGGKLLAALLVKRPFGYTWAEDGVVFSLSIGQAAATLATTFVGRELGLFDERLVNAVIVVILLSIILGSAAAMKFGKRIPAATPSEERLGRKVVVALPENEETAASFVKLAASLADADSGNVVPLKLVVDEQLAPPDAAGSAKMLAEAQSAITKEGLETDVLLRVDTSKRAGLLHTAAAEHGSILLVEESGRGLGATAIVGSEDDELIAASPLPVILARLCKEPFRRVIVALDARDLFPLRSAAQRFALSLAARLAKRSPLSLVLPDARAAGSLADEDSKATVIAPVANRLGWLRAHAEPGDLVILPAPQASLVAFGRIAAAVAGMPGVSVAVVAAPGRTR